MKRFTFLLLSLMLFGFLGAQNVVFHEDFEQPSGADSVTAYSSDSGNVNTWGISTDLAAGGLQSDSAKITPNDTLTLTTDAFSTTGNAFVTLDFDHIAKIQIVDKAIIEVSIDNGASWTKLDTTHYMGASTKFGDLGNIFNAGAYPSPSDWAQGSPTNTVPDNSWWKHETFNISSIAADESSVIIRFSLIDAGFDVSPDDDYAWFLDNIEIGAATSEMVPPEIVLGTPIIEDTITSPQPQTIKAKITDDDSNVDTAFVVYYVNGNLTDSIGMTNFQADSFKADIPFPGFGRTVTYFVEAIDDAAAQNHGTSSNYSYFVKHSPDIHTVVFSEGFNTGTAGDSWSGTGWTNPSDNWEYETDETGSPDTGPDGPYEGTGYVYTEGTSGHNETMELTSPAINISNLDKPFLSFYYHMYGGHMGELNIDLYDGTTWHNGVWSKSGEQHSSKSDPWTKAFVNISSYKNSATKIRFRGITGDDFESDMSVDDVKVGETYLGFPDAGIAEITNPTGGVITNNNFDVKVKFQNKGDVNLNQVDIDWEVDGNSKSTYNWTGTLEPDSLSSEITLGTESVSSGAHNLKVWTANPNDTVDFNIANDTMQFNFYGCDNILSGTYTIGGSNPDYATFAEAALALNQCGINGPVTFNVAAGTYSDQITLSDISGASATNTITFQSATSDSSDVTLQYAAANAGENHVVKLEGTSYITFKDMTFKAQNNDWPRVFAMNSGADNISLTNNRFEGVNLSSGTGSADSALVIVEDSIGNDFTFTHNYLQGGTHGLNISGNGITNVTVNNNEFINQWTIGARINGANAPEIKNNQVETNTTADFFNGIRVANTNGTFEIAYNKVYAPTTIVGYAFRVEFSKGDSLNHAKVYNNMATVRGIDGSTMISAGIINKESRFIDYYYNTFRTIGTDELATPLCLYDNNAGETRYLTIKNNIFVNNTEGHIIYTQNIDTAGFDHDYNNYYQTGSNIFGQFNGDDVDDFATFQSMSGQEANSVQYDPYFADTTDLHVANNFLNNLGTPISGITVDIDGDSRDATNPDMGADEFDASPYDLAVLEVYGPQNSCGLSSAEDITLKVQNIGTSNINSFDASYMLLNDSSIVTETVNTTINAGDSLEYTFSSKVDMDMSTFMKDSTFEFKAWTDHSSDPVPQNDSAATSVLSQYQPPAPTASTFSTNYGDSVTITATSNDTLVWYETDTSSNDIAKGKYFTTPPLYDTTDFWVEAKSISNFINIIGNGTTTQNYVPAYGYYDYSWSAQIINASELSGAAILDTIGFYVDNSPSNFEMLDQRIYIAHISNSEFTSTAKPDPSTMDYVFQGDLMYDGSGWKNIALDTPFDYNGSDHLLVYFENHDGSYVLTGYPEWRSTSVSGDKVKYDNQDGSMPTTDGSFTSNRPNIRLVGKSLGCPSPRVPVTVNVTGYPTEDAGPVAMISPASSVQEGSQQYIDVEVKNFAVDPLTSLNISWELDSVFQKTYSWTGNIDYKETDTIRIDTASFTGGAHDIRFWTTQPNGTVDTINSNDTIQATLTACLNGVYTIGDTTGGNIYDYVSFSDAVEAIVTGGVCGNVVFEVDSGNYNEQIVIPEISGADSANTITFTSMSGDSTDVVLENDFNSSTDNYTVQFDKASYTTFQNMTLKASGSSYSRVVELMGGSHHVTLKNNIVEGNSVTSTSTDNIVIGSGNTDDNYNAIKYNHIKNGSYGIYFEGESSSNKEKGNQIVGNIVEDFYYYGMYIDYQDSVYVTDNEVNTLTTYGYGTYGISVRYSDRINILRNKLAIAPDDQNYGIRIYYCDGTLNEPGLVANNMVSITSGADDNYGLYLYNSEYLHVYYNTVNITGGDSDTRAVYIDISSTYPGFRFVNNNIRDSVSYALEFVDYDGIDQMDYNNYYTNTGSLVNWDGTDLTTLSDYQTTSGFDANSYNLEPMFVSSTNLYLLSKQLAGTGIPLSEVTTDINGKTRDSQITTVGAEEINLIPKDIGITDILNVPDTVMEFDTINPHVIVINSGTDTISDYSIEYTTNGSTPVTKVLTGDTILPFGGKDTIALDPFSSPAGLYQLCATTVLAQDSNQINNQKCKSVFGTPIIDGKITHVDDLASGCNLTEDTIRITIKNMGVDTIDPGFDAKYQVDGNTLVTESVTSQILPNDSITFEFADLVDLSVTTFDSIFNIAAWVEIPNDNVDYNDTNYVETKSMHTPATPVVNDISVVKGFPATLTGDATAPIHWFYQDTSANAFHKGDTLQTDVLYSDTTFWFQAINGGDMNTVIGQGTATQNYVPAYGFYDYGWSAMIFEASEIGSGGPIDTIGFYVDNSPSNYEMLDQRIYIAHISSSEFTSTAKPDPSSMDYVFQGDLIYDGSGWKNIALDTPFDYNGNDHLLVYFENHNGSFSSNYPVWQSTAVTGDKVKYDYQDNSFPTTNGTFQSERPNTRFVGGGDKCVSLRDSVNVQVVTPDDNAELSDIIVSSGCNLTANEPVSIDIYNMGAQTIDGNITASYRVNGGSYISPENVTTVINPGDTGTYTFNATVDMFAPQGDTSFVFEAYVNLSGDTIASNDSLVSGSIVSKYTPSAPTLNNQTITFASKANLSYSSTDSLFWYKTSSATQEFLIGNSYTTPILYDTTTYYVEQTLFSPFSAQIGTGTQTTKYIPAYGFYDYGWSNSLYLSNEVGSAGMIDTVYFYVDNSISSYVMPDQTMYLANEASSSLTTAKPDPANMTKVFNGSVDWNGPGWFAIPLDNSFFYDGQSNLQIYWENRDGDWDSDSPEFRASTTSGDYAVYEYQDNSFPVSSGTISSERPNIKLAGANVGCGSPRVPWTVNVIGHPDTDVQLASVMEPSTGQLKTATEPVQFRIKNNGTDSLYNIIAGYEFDGGNPVVENLNVNMGPGDTLEHTFNSTVDMSDYRAYPFTGYVNNPDDTVSINDTIIKSVQNKLDYCESRATSDSYNYIENVSVSYMDNSSSGAAQYTDFSFSVQPPVIYPGETHPMEIQWGNTSATNYSDVALKVFIDVNRDGIFNEATETFFVDSSATENDTIFTDDITIPAGTAAGKAAMRVVLERTDDASGVTPCGTYTYGETEDYLIQVTPFIPEDAGVVDILKPGAFVINQNQQFEVVVQNFGSSDLTGLDINYTMGNMSDSHTYNGTIASQTRDTMSMPILSIPYGNNKLCAYTSHSNDSNTFNDKHCIKVYRQYTTTPPYYDNLEGKNYFMQDTSQIKQTQWELGYPLGNNITGAHSGNNAWMIDLDSNYANSTQDFLYSPRFAITSVGVDSLIFWHYIDAQQGADGGRVDYLNQNGDWRTLGEVNDSAGQNWYTDTVLGSPAFSGNSNGWVRSSICIDSTHLTDMANITQFRFVFTADGSNNNGDGWAIDDFEITIPKVDTDAGVKTVLNPVSSTTTGDNVSVEVEVKNYGYNTQTSFPVTYQIDNNTPVTENWSGNLTTDQTDTYTFNTTYTAPASDYTITTYTGLANDGNTYNDTVSHSITSEAADLDAGIVDIAPVGNSYHDTTFYGKDVNVKVWIHNYGKQDITSMDVEYVQNNNTPVTETWNGNLASGDTIEYTFSQGYTVGVIGKYEVCGRTLLSGDAYAANDEYCEDWEGRPEGVASNDLAGFVLHQNIPNPAGEETSIDFEVPYGGKAQFEVVDLFGRKLYSDELTVGAGRHTVDLNAKNWAAGVYYYSITFDGHKLVRKMVVTR